MRNIDRKLLSHIGIAKPYEFHIVIKTMFCISSTRFLSLFMHPRCLNKRFIVKKTVIGCCICSFVFCTLSEALTIHFAICFWSVSAFVVSASIFVAYLFTILLYDDISEVGGKAITQLKSALVENLLVLVLLGEVIFHKLDE